MVNYYNIKLNILKTELSIFLPKPTLPHSPPFSDDGNFILLLRQKSSTP